jgi:hypothetical protein
LGNEELAQKKSEYACKILEIKQKLKSNWSGVSLIDRAKLLKNRHKDLDVCPRHTSITILLYGMSLELVNLFSITYRKKSFCHSPFWGKLRVSDLRTGTIVVFQWMWQAALLLPISDDIRSKSFAFEDSRNTGLSIFSGFS